MKALMLTNKGMTREFLLRIADEIPGTWMGNRIAAYLLMLKGWRSSQIAELFGLTRCAVVKWIRKGNEMGVQGTKDKARLGRPSRFDE
jgi:hypothetical protein